MKIKYIYWECEVTFENQETENLEFYTEELLSEEEILLKIDDYFNIYYNTKYQVRNLRFIIECEDIDAERDYSI